MWQYGEKYKVKNIHDNHQRTKSSVQGDELKTLVRKVILDVIMGGGGKNKGNRVILV